MERMAELVRRENALRERLVDRARGSAVIDPTKPRHLDLSAVPRLSEQERQWLTRELSEMQMLLERYLADLEGAQREAVRYKMHLALPVFFALRDAVELFYRVQAVPG